MKLIGIVRPVHADEAQGDLHVLRPGFLLDQLQRPQRDRFRAVNLRARRRAQPHLKLACLDPGKDLRAQPAAQRTQ